MTNIIGQVAGGTISNGQGCYGASLLPDTFKKVLLTLAEDRCEFRKGIVPYVSVNSNCVHPPGQPREFAQNLPGGRDLTFESCLGDGNSTRAGILWKVQTMLSAI